MSYRRLVICLIALLSLSAAATAQDFSHQHIQRGFSPEQSRYQSSAVEFDAYPSGYLQASRVPLEPVMMEEGNSLGFWIATSFAILFLSGAALTATSFRQRRSPQVPMLRVPSS